MLNIKLGEYLTLLLLSTCVLTHTYGKLTKVTIQ